MFTSKTIICLFLTYSIVNNQLKIIIRFQNRNPRNTIPIFFFWLLGLNLLKCTPSPMPINIIPIRVALRMIRRPDRSSDKSHLMRKKTFGGVYFRWPDESYWNHRNCCSPVAYKDDNIALKILIPINRFAVSAFDTVYWYRKLHYISFRGKFCVFITRARVMYRGSGSFFRGWSVIFSFIHYSNGGFDPDFKLPVTESGVKAYYTTMSYPSLFMIYYVPSRWKFPGTAVDRVFGNATKTTSNFDFTGPTQNNR